MRLLLLLKPRVLAPVGLQGAGSVEGGGANLPIQRWAEQPSWPEESGTLPWNLGAASALDAAGPWASLITPGV